MMDLAHVTMRFFTLSSSHSVQICEETTLVLYDSSSGLTFELCPCLVLSTNHNAQWGSALTNSQLKHESGSLLWYH